MSEQRQLEAPRINQRYVVRYERRECVEYEVDAASATEAVVLVTSDEDRVPDRHEFGPWRSVSVELAP